jgi:beta-lactamase superfamily II metal-dependent hydrolase
MRRIIPFVLFIAIPTAASLAQTRSKTLDIYDIDTEGGHAVLFVSPSGETALLDTGWPGVRDAHRIMEAAKTAGVKQIDYLVITHFHADHIGGFMELAKFIPIKHYVDHGVTVQPEQHIESKQAYDAAIVKGLHIIVKPGDKLPITGIDWTIVSSAGKTLATNMTGVPGAGQTNPYCAGFVPKNIQVDLENAESVGSVIAYGRFRTMDLGDLLWNFEGQLACPVNRIGTIDLLLTTHHGSNWSGVPALIYAIKPKVAIMNNGSTKGGSVEAFETLESSPGLEDIWQLHWSANGLLEHNAAGKFIANLEKPAITAGIIANPPPPTPPGALPAAIGNPDHSPAYWIKVSAKSDGTFTVTNIRNGFSKTYRTGN